VCGVVEREESVLFQHGGDGDRFREMERREIHGKIRVLDESTEEV
jgi:hypothetical protein